MDQNKTTDEIKNTKDVIIRNESAVSRQWRATALNDDTIQKLTEN